LNNLSNTYLQSILGPLQNAGLSSSTTSASAVAGSQDQSGLSPFAQVLTTLQQLQQSNPTEYQQVTQQIATNFQTAAQTAQSQGNSTAANQLNQLATDFNNASSSGQLPNVQDLAKAIGGGHHHHHRHGGSGSSAAATSSSNSSSSTASQLFSAFQTNGTQSDALNPTSIILNTLSSAGIGSSSS